jgi:hypothetical protein
MLPGPVVQLVGGVNVVATGPHSDQREQQDEHFLLRGTGATAVFKEDRASGDWTWA